MMANLKAGLIGLGMMGRHHARVLRQTEGVDLVAVADPGGDPHGVAGGLAVGTSVNTLLDAGVDYAVIAVPTQYHEEISLQLADNGVHALVEKPLAASVKSSERVTAAFEAAGLVGAVGHIERYNPSLQQLRSRLENGDLGDVYQVVTRRQGPFPSRIADVGVIKDLATHDIDLTAWITQSPYVSIAAQTAHRSGREHEDLVASTGLLKDGTIASHLVNWLSPMKERVTIVTGSKGAFVADTLTADLTYYANGTVKSTWDQLAEFRGVTEGDMIRFSYAKVEPLRTEHEAFRDAVRGIRADIVTMREGTETVRVAEAMLEAAKTGNTISI